MDAEQAEIVTFFVQKTYFTDVSDLMASGRAPQAELCPAALIGETQWLLLSLNDEPRRAQSFTEKI